MPIAYRTERQTFDAVEWIYDRDAIAARLDRGPLQAVIAVPEPTDVIPADASTPYLIPIGDTATGVINGAGDVDWFRVSLQAGVTYSFRVIGDSLVDPFLTIYRADSSFLAGQDNARASLDPLLTITPQEDAVYYLAARAANNTQTGTYTVTANYATPVDAVTWNYHSPTNNIDVYFATSGQFFHGESAVRSWTQTEIDAAMAALATFSAVTPLTFTRTNTSAGAEMILTLANLGSGVLGAFDVGTPYGFFNPSARGWSDGLAQGGFGFVTLLHEFGHGLGLAHTHDTAGGSTLLIQVSEPFGDYGFYSLNQGIYTTMGYNDGWPDGPLGLSAINATGWQGTPMAIDIAALQDHYGVNPTYNNGDNVYGLGSSHAFYQSIWDAGGADAITYTGSAAAVIDLRAATLRYEVGGGGFVSYVTGTIGGFTIANGVIIENASGGSGADAITGNDAANALSGNGGGDTLTGNAGNDVLDGGAGVDRLFGGDGNDAIFYDATDDLANVLGGNGVDTLVFTGGAAPTSFNLTSHGFEFGEGRFVVTGATYSDFYDIQWRLSHEEGEAANGNSWFIDWDETGSAPYQRIDQDFDALGNFAHEHGLSDNNSTWDIYYDTDGTHAYVSLLQVRTAGGVFANEHGISDNGSTWDTFYDVDGTNPFQWVQQVRDALNVLAQEEGLADGGTSWFTDYDETGTTDYIFYQNVYDTLDRLSFQNGEYDTGHTWTIDYDETETQAWTSIRNDYDENGNLIGTTTIWDGP